MGFGQEGRDTEGVVGIGGSSGVFEGFGLFRCMDCDARISGVAGWLRPRDAGVGGCGLQRILLLLICVCMSLCCAYKEAGFYGFVVCL